MSPATGADTAIDVAEFQRLLDKKSLVCLLDVFLANESTPVTRGDLEDFSGMSQPTVSRRVQELCEIGIVERSESDSPRLFRLNMEHPAAEGLLDAYSALHEHVTEIKEASEDYDSDSNLFHAGSPFVELFRYPTNVAILAAFLERPDATLQPAEVARIADVDKSTVGDNIDILVTIGVVEVSHPDYAQYPKYELDRTHPAIDGFLTMLKDLNWGSKPAAPNSKKLRLDDQKKRQEVKKKLAHAVPKDETPDRDRSEPDGTTDTLEQIRKLLATVRDTDNQQLSGQEAPSTDRECSAARQIDDDELSYQYHRAANTTPSSTGGCAA